MCFLFIVLPLAFSCSPSSVCFSCVDLLGIVFVFVFVSSALFVAFHLFTFFSLSVCFHLFSFLVIFSVVLSDHVACVVAFLAVFCSWRLWFVPAMWRTQDLSIGVVGPFVVEGGLGAPVVDKASNKFVTSTACGTMPTFPPTSLSSLRKQRKQRLRVGRSANTAIAVAKHDCVARNLQTRGSSSHLVGSLTLGV